MPDSRSDGELASAILASVETGAFPQSEDIASTELPPDALPAILQELKQAREAFRAEVIGIDTGPEVDRWIAQAKQLQADIEHSKSVAREIVEQAEHAKLLQEQRRDAASKAELLRIEVSFTENLEDTLEQIRGIAVTLAKAQEEVLEGNLERSLEQLQDVKARLQSLGSLSNISAVDVVHQRVERLEDVLAEQVRYVWKRLLDIDHNKSSITISDEAKVECEKTSLSINNAIDMSSKLNFLESIMLQLCRDIDGVILKPCLSASKHSKLVRMAIDGRQLSLSSDQQTTNATTLIEDITAMAHYFNDSLPPIMSGILSDALMPSLLSRLISRWLVPAVPTALEEMHDFQTLLERVRQLSDDLGSIGWSGGDDLQEWIEEAPQIWLARKRESTLIAARTLIATKIHETHTVERVETQTISPEESEAQPDESNENWDEAWTEDAALQDDTRKQDAAPNPDDNEEADAWGVDDDPASSIPPTPSKPAQTPNDDAADDWGWGGDDPTSPKDPHKPSQPNGAAPREITLRETYTITGVPDALHSLLTALAADASLLASPTYASTTMLPPASSLNTLASLVLVAFRALAPTHYDALPAAGPMHLYNDCIRLGEALRPDTTPAADVAALAAFARRTYARDLAAQRTILLDLLDGAQGFAHSTTPPFAGAAGAAVAATCERVRALHAQWRGVLSTSALLQSVGALVGAVVAKMGREIGELADIGERESAALKSFCEEVLGLRALFVQADEGASQGDEESARDLASVCVAGWLRFQYLAEILESSLADIRWLWREGGLRRDFEAGEVVDLVEALFAESALRREAIAEIRRG